MIRGLSDKRRLPRLGKIRLGVVIQEPGKKPYPRATDHFVVPPAVAKLYGEEPKDLPIMFPGDDPARLFPQDYKMYRSAGLWCSGNGETAKRWTDRGELKELVCPCPYLESGECSPTATLNFLLPDVPGIGVWQITTTNQRSIVSLNTSLELFSSRNMFGGLAGIPFQLKLRPEPLQRFDEKAGRMVKQTLQVLSLDSLLPIREIIEWRQKSGKPVEALMPASFEEDEPLSSAGGSETPDPPGTGEEWDISLCFASAKKLGVEVPEYTAYLLGVYGKDVDNLPPDALTEQRGILEKALADPVFVGTQLAEAIRLVAKKVQKRNGGKQPAML